MPHQFTARVALSPAGQSVLTRIRRETEVRQREYDAIDAMSISELRRELAIRDDRDEFEILPRRREWMKSVLEDKVDQRDFRVKVAQIIVAAFIGCAGVTLSVAQLVTAG